jgi:hypothetical protein
LPVAAIVGGIGSAVGGIFGASSASKAAKAQVDAATQAANLQHQDAQAALAFQQQQQAQAQQNMQPWLSTGQSSLGALSWLMGLSPSAGQGGKSPWGRGIDPLSLPSGPINQQPAAGLNALGGSGNVQDFLNNRPNIAGINRMLNAPQGGVDQNGIPINPASTQLFNGLPAEQVIGVQQ